MENSIEPDLDYARKFVHGLVEAAIKKRSSRDFQHLPGPSDLANPCDLCVARTIAKSIGVGMPQPSENFSLKAWNGTAVHKKLEEDLLLVYPLATTESTVEIATIEGLGVIKGHIDLYLPKAATVNDYKTTDLEKLETYRTLGIPVSHLGQVMLYAYGLRRSGREVRYVTITYIPRDSNKVSDVWVDAHEYQENIALELLNRAHHLTRMVESLQADALGSHPDCYVCSVRQFVTS